MVDFSNFFGPQKCITRQSVYGKLVTWFRNAETMLIRTDRFCCSEYMIVKSPKVSKELRRDLKWNWAKDNGSTRREMGILTGLATLYRVVLYPNATVDESMGYNTFYLDCCKVLISKACE